ncbi:MAG: hypothetical protein CMC05_01175 [Flavobacteriaceae bacterium]|nr:hypothetical protein [Flavobacteriaceae bacterium]MBD10508.1 hypothetical protein [Flavobacteriaceae bacterium]|tara:strand:+ start:8179 stop:8433 length:255 start_codon:yes stop_codon:yes gene_type:complete
MNNEDYAELFKYCSPYSILVVTWYGKLKILNCPITVKLKQDIGLFKKGDYKKVSKVLLSSEGKTVFVIDSNAYYYHYFDILTHL